MCVFQVTFVNEKGWRVTVYARSPNWIGVEKEGRKALNKAKEHEKYGPWTYYSSNRIE